MSFAYYILGLLKYIFHVFKVPNNSLILLYGCIILNLPLMFQSWAIQTHQMKDTGSFWSTKTLEEGQLASVSTLTHKTLHKAPEMLFLLWRSARSVSHTSLHVLKCTWIHWKWSLYTSKYRLPCVNGKSKRRHLGAGKKHLHSFLNSQAYHQEKR